MGAASAHYAMGIIKISLYSNPQGRFPAKVTAIISPSFITLLLRLRGRGVAEGDEGTAEGTAEGLAVAAVPGGGMGTGEGDTVKATAPRLHRELAKTPIFFAPPKCKAQPQHSVAVSFLC